jgi:CRP-like cAMP-binding protein
MPSSKTIYQNRLLNRLSAGDRELLEPNLVECNLDLLHVLEEPGQRITHVYFIDAGIASVVAHSAQDKQIEIGLIGREGVTGTSVILGNSQSPLQTYVQVAGSAMRISTPKLWVAIAESATLAGLLLKYVQSIMVQTAHTAYANALGRVDERLARWLLMADDRCGDTIPLSHEFLSIMLGVRRTGITESLGELQRRGMIGAGRGRIQILDRPALTAKAGAYYGAPEAEYRRLIG